MSKYCMEQYEFERKVKEIVRKISDIQEEMKEHKKILLTYQSALRNISLKGGCESCKNRVECLTNEQNELSKEK